MNKPDLVLHNLLWLICHQTKPNQKQNDHKIYKSHKNPIENE